MISLLLVYSFVGFVLFGAGVLVCIFMKKFRWLSGDYLFFSPDFFLLIGLAAISTFLGFYSLFLPVNLAITILLFSIIYLLVLVNRKTFRHILSTLYSRITTEKNILLISLLVFAPLLIAIFVFSLSKIQSFDTGLYHAQYIQWIEKYKTVPGLVWIHSRFAFNSHFHLTSALFTFSSLHFKNEELTPLVFYPLNGFFFLLFAFRSIFKITKGLLTKDIFTAILYASLLFCSFCIFGPKLQSPMPDISVCILTLYVFIIFLEHFRFSKEFVSHELLLTFLIFLLPTFKVSAGFIILLLIPIVLRKTIKNILPIFIIGVVIVTPFLARNVILSGYPIYALPQLDVFNVDWKYPLENVMTDNAVVKAWARIPYKNYVDVLSLPFKDWLVEWWRIYAYDLIKSILKVCLISPIIIIPFFLIRKRKTDVKMQVIMYAVLVVNLIFWFISAPDPRFAWGFLFFTHAFTLASVASLIKVKRIEFVVGIGIFYFLYKSLWYTSNDWSKITSQEALASVRYYPQQLESAPVEIFKDGAFPLWTPLLDDGRCFNSPIPCTPYPLRKVRLRGRSLRDGFFYDANLP